MQTSAGKAVASIFWDKQDILFIDYLEKGRIIYSIIGTFEGKKKKKKKKKATNEEIKCALSPRQCTVSQVNYNNGKST